MNRRGSCHGGPNHLLNLGHLILYAMKLGAAWTSPRLGMLFKILIVFISVVEHLMYVSRLCFSACPGVQYPSGSVSGARHFHWGCLSHVSISACRNAQNSNPRMWDGLSGSSETSSDFWVGIYLCLIETVLMCTSSLNTTLGNFQQKHWLVFLFSAWRYMTTNSTECSYPYDSATLGQILVAWPSWYPTDFTGFFYVRRTGFYSVSLDNLKGSREKPCISGMK